MDAELHNEILEYLHDMYLKKNSDYGSSVHDTYEKYGLTAYLVRMEDKVNRVRTLFQKGQQLVSDETIEDSLLDLSNYCILAVMELRNDHRRGEPCQN